MRNKNTLQQIISRMGPRDKKSWLEIDKKDLEGLKTVSEVVLVLVACAGAITLSAVAPNIFIALGSMRWVKKIFSNNATKYKEQGRKIGKSFSYLKTKGYISITPKGEDFEVQISQRGRDKILNLKYSKLSIKKPVSWDGKWWLVIVDVPNDMKDFADYFRKKIKALGLFPLQKSVWAYPYDLREEIAFISAYYNVDRFTTTMKVDELEPEDQEKLLSHLKKLGFYNIITNLVFRSVYSCLRYIAYAVLCRQRLPGQVCGKCEV